MSRDITLYLVRFYLQRWGAYIRHDKKLSGSSISIIGRMIEEGPGASQATSLILADEPEGVAIIQHIYHDMPEQLRAVLKVKYIDNKNNNIAKRLLNISMVLFRERLCQAEGHVQGAMRFLKK